MHSRLGPCHHIAISMVRHIRPAGPGTRPNDVVVAGFLSRAQDALEVSPSTCDPLGQSLHPHVEASGFLLIRTKSQKSQYRAGEKMLVRHQLDLDPN